MSLDKNPDKEVNKEPGKDFDEELELPPEDFPLQTDESKLLSDDSEAPPGKPGEPGPLLDDSEAPPGKPGEPGPSLDESELPPEEPGIPFEEPEFRSEEPELPLEEFPTEHAEREVRFEESEISEAETTPQPPAPVAAAPSRIASLDALRGFDMFWIIGGAELAHALAKQTQWPFMIWLSDQMHHVEWNGFQAMDLIFPLFLFISGVTIPLSLKPRIERGDSSFGIHARIIRRGLLLVLLGCIYNGLLNFDWENMRYPSVLGHIGLAWMFAALIFIHTDFRKQLICIVVILLGYWAALKLIPVPGAEAGDLTMKGSLAGYIDRLLLPGKLYKGVHDPEGILSTIPAIATALMGALTGQLLRSKQLRNITKVPVMVGIGGLCLGIAYVWSWAFPINKNLWSSSFVLCAGGWSLILLAVFYFLVDICRLKPLAFVFIVIGMNPITIYLCAGGLIDFSSTGHYLFNGVLKFFSGEMQEVVWLSCVLLLEWLFLFYLYRRKLFLRV